MKVKPRLVSHRRVSKAGSADTLFRPLYYKLPTKAQTRAKDRKRERFAMAYLFGGMDQQAGGASARIYKATDVRQKFYDAGWNAARELKRLMRENL